MDRYGDWTRRSGDKIPVSRIAPSLRPPATIYLENMARRIPGTSDPRMQKLQVDIHFDSVSKFSRWYHGTLRHVARATLLLTLFPRDIPKNPR
jgi:hypothetical protein